MSKVFYRDDNVMLIQGDCLEVMPKLKRKFDAIITDPPYGTTVCRWDTVIPFDKMWECLSTITRENGAVVLFAAQPFTSALVMSNPKKFKYEWIYTKTKGVGYLNSKKMPITNHENILIFADGKTTYNPQFSEGKPYKRVHRNEKAESSYGKSSRKDGDTLINDGVRYPTTSILPIANPSGRGQLHPTQKPIALLEYLIKTYTNEGETVLDFTSGSGTTLIAALNTGRRAVGIEMDEKYCEITVNRIKEHYANNPTNK